jgi:hypothetical protein
MFEKERGEYCSKRVGCFDDRGRLCFCVVFIRANNNVCICEKMIFFHGFNMGTTIGKIIMRYEINPIWDVQSFTFNDHLIDDIIRLQII